MLVRKKAAALDHWRECTVANGVQMPARRLERAMDKRDADHSYEDVRYAFDDGMRISDTLSDVTDFSAVYDRVK